MEKLEWLGYPMVKKFEDIFIRFGATHERDRQQTDGHHMMAIVVLMHSIARQNFHSKDMLFVLTEFMNVTDTHADERTPHGKDYNKTALFLFYLLTAHCHCWSNVQTDQTHLTQPMGNGSCQWTDYQFPKSLSNS